MTWRTKWVLATPLKVRRFDQPSQLASDECWRNSQVTEEAERVLLNRRFTAWAVRMPDSEEQVATLIYFNKSDRAFRDAYRESPLYLNTESFYGEMRPYHRTVMCFEDRLKVSAAVMMDKAWDELGLGLDLHLNHDFPPEVIARIFDPY